MIFVNISEELSLYVHSLAVKEFDKYPNKRFLMIECPEQHRQPVLRLELALIEIGPLAAGTMHSVGRVLRIRVLPSVSPFSVKPRSKAACATCKPSLVAIFADRNMADAGHLDLPPLTR